MGVNREDLGSKSKNVEHFEEAFMVNRPRNGQGLSAFRSPWYDRRSMAPAWGPKVRRPGQFLGADGDQNGRDLPQHALFETTISEFVDTNQMH